MDDAKKLLDSLMGQTRNIPLKEAKKKKGQNFKEDDVCKFYLIGFCPQHEQLFRNTKRHLNECDKIHSDALKEEFEAHPQKDEYEIKYTRDLVRYLEGIVRTADEAIARQARNIQAANKELEDCGPNDVAKREIEKIREQGSQLLAEAEQLAETGDVGASKAKQWEYEQTKQKADEYETRSKMPIKEEVCEICGLRPEDGDGMRKFSHTEGKIHIGFVKVRDWLANLRVRMKECEKKRDLDKYGKDRERDRDRDRDREREREKDNEDRKKKEDDRKNDKPEGERAEEAVSQGDGAAAGDAEKSGQDKPDGDKSVGDKSGGDRPSGDKASGDKPGADRDRDQRRDRDQGRGRDDRSRERGDRGDGDRGRRRGGDRDDGGYDRRGSGGGGRRGGDRGYDDSYDRRGGGGRDRDRGYEGHGRDRRQRSRSRDQRRGR